MSVFFIFGSFWYMDIVYSGDEMKPILDTALGLGIPATVILLISLRFPKLGSGIGVTLAGLAFCWFLIGAIGGDMEERYIRSLAVSKGKI